MYTRFIKRSLDAAAAFSAILMLLPLMMVLTVTGTVCMKGNPFFTQIRAGKNEKPFRLVKFRTMNNKTDANGKLLPDDMRLTGYGKFLRSTSIDELPELFNILKGDMSFVGPRPLPTEYLPYYKQNERKRHSVLPGLTGLAQINGRNAIESWEERFAYDIEYTEKISFCTDLKIFLSTFRKVITRADVLTGSEIKAGRLDDARRKHSYDGNDKKIHRT